MITIFEKYWTENELKIPKLKNHLTSLFEKIGFSVNYSRAAENDNRYFYKNKNDILFYIRTSGDLLTINMLSKMDIIQFIPTYLKTINGLMVDHKKDWTQFEVKILDDNINNIIKQITKKDFELKLKINKYNI
jgi:hypothetical protein